MTIKTNGINFQDPLRSKPVNNDIETLTSAANNLQDQIDAIITPASGSEVTNARDYHGSLRDRIRSGDSATPNSVITGFAVTESGTPDMYINVSDGEAIVSGVGIDRTSISPILITAPTLAHQLQVVVVSSDNTVSVVEGTEHATNYLMPTISSTQKPIALLVLSSGTTSINEDTELFDARDQGCWYRKDGRLNFEFYIQDAIDDLPNGGIINIGNGNYYESLTYDDNQTLIFDNNATLYDLTATEINYDEIDLSSNTNIKIIYSDGINSLGYNFNSTANTFNTDIYVNDLIYGISVNVARKYSWSQVGSTKSTSANNSAIASLSNNTIVVFDNTLDTIRAYEFNGSTWSQTTYNSEIASAMSLASMSNTRFAKYSNTGVNGILQYYYYSPPAMYPTGSIIISGGGAYCAMAALTSTRIAFIDDGNDDLRVYDWTGSTWSQTGSDLNIPGIGLPSMAALTSTRIAFIDDTNDDLRVYDFDGSTWSQNGSDLNIPGISKPSITALSSSRVAYIDETNDELRIYDFNGSTWERKDGSYQFGSISAPIITALSPNRIAYIPASGISTFDMLADMPPSPAF